MAGLEQLTNGNSVERIRNICCVGAGYVGGPTAAVIAFQNPDICVTVVDLSADRIQKWRTKHLPIHEPGLSDIVRVARDGSKATTITVSIGSTTTIKLPARQRNLFFTTDVSRSIAEAELIFLCINTPTKLSGIGAGSATDMFALDSATRTIAEAAKPGAIIVEKSTVPCRTASWIHEVLQIHRPGISFEILSNPEFLAEGCAIKDLLDPDRVLIGSAQTPSGRRAATALKNIYAAWIDPAKIILVNLWSSELTKLAANAMLAQRISSINSISAVCERTGADIDQVAYAIGLDPRLGPKFLKAGLGFGGSCFKKDILSLIYLSSSLNLPEVADYWQQVLIMNEFQRTRFVHRVVANLHGTLIGKKIALLGYAFKNNTSDTRESPAIDVVKLLLADRPSEIAIFDPRCNPADIKDELKRLFSIIGVHLLKPKGPIEVYNNAYDACVDASAALILTEWPQFSYPHPDAQESAFSRNDNRKSNGISRPSFRRALSELDIIEIRQHMAADHARQCENERAQKSAETDPLERYIEEPACADNCVDCARGLEEEKKASENVDWARISRHMQKPKWVFDGRGLVDLDGMEKLDFRVEGIGKVGSRSRLNDSTNAWGDDNSGFQCVSAQDATAFNATWRWASKPDFVHSYPNIALSTPLLPLRLNNLSSLTVKASWSMGPTGAAPPSPPVFLDVPGLASIETKANVALDMFLDADPIKAQSTTRAANEIMIWFGTVGGSLPIGAKSGTQNQGQCKVKGTKYTLTTGPNQSAQTVFSWLATTNVTLTTPTDFEPLVTYLWENNFLPSNDIYLGTIQFGSETFHSTANVNFVVEDGFELVVRAGQKARGWNKKWVALPVLFVVLSVLGGLLWWFRRKVVGWIERYRN